MLKYFLITIILSINNILSDDNVFSFDNLWKFTTENIKKSESNYFLVDPNKFFNENDKNSITEKQKEILDKNNVYTYIFFVEKLQEKSNEFTNKLKEDLSSNIKTSFNDKDKNSIILLFSLKDEMCYIKAGEELVKNISNLKDFSFDNNNEYIKEKNYNLFVKKYLHDFQFYLDNPIQPSNSNSNQQTSNQQTEPKEQSQSNNNNNNEQNNDSKQNEKEEENKNKEDDNSNNEENKENENNQTNNDENINNEKNRGEGKNDFDYDDDDKKKGIGWFGKFIIFCIIVGLLYLGYNYYYKRKKKVGLLNFNYDNYNKMNNSGQELSNNEFAYYK